PLHALHLHVLPLFNGEPLRAPIEELNQKVREHMQATIGRSPSKALATLKSDFTDLVATGMLNLDAKLTTIDDEKFLTRLVEVWNFFWVQVLPYIEGV
ncbi:HbrB-like protein, partial [Clavulina sp. PMI_390]